MSKPKNSLSSLVGYGGVLAIAKKLGLKPGTASAALRRGTPSHPAVQEAVRMAEENGAIATAQTLSSIAA